MKTILVPVDFSKSSKAALSFAVLLAEKKKARIVMLTVITSIASENTLANWKKLEASLVNTAKKDAVAMIKTIQLGQVDIVHRSILGFPIADRIEQFIKENKVDLIVMGSKGAAGLKKTFIGSNSAAMIQKSRVPVIVVPEKARIKQLKTFVYASDVKNFESEMRSIARWTKELDARIHVLHITGTKLPALNQRKLEDELNQYPNAELHILKSKDIINSIETFAKDQEADMIILFTHTVGFYEKLFGKSVTRQFAFKGTLPLLTFNRSNI